jgi:putative membrane protein
MNLNVRSLACGTVVLLSCTLLGACKAKIEEHPSGDTISTATRTDTMSTSPTTTTPDTMATAPKMSDANIFASLDAANSLEIAEGKIGQQKGKNADVKAFARMLVDDHSKMKQEGSDLAKKLNITPAPPAGDTSVQEMEHSSQMLSSTSAASFDSVFIAHEIDGHRKTLDALNMMGSQATSDSLKTLISGAIPKVQHHLDRAMEIQGKLGSGTTAMSGTSGGSGSMGKMSDTGKSDGKMKGKSY